MYGCMYRCICVCNLLLGPGYISHYVCSTLLCGKMYMREPSECPGIGVLSVYSPRTELFVGGERWDGHWCYPVEAMLFFLFFLFYFILFRRRSTRHYSGCSPVCSLPYEPRLFSLLFGHMVATPWVG